MIFCIIVILLSVIVDQVSKMLVAAALPAIGSLPLIQDILHFTYVENRGAAFGMLENHRWIFMVLSVLGIGAMAVWLVIEKPKSRWMQAAVALVIGGGIGNMIDRVRLGYVIDFIDCRFIDFYVFNIADSCVCVGCALFLLIVVIEEVKSQKAKKDALPDEGEADASAEEPDEVSHDGK